MRVGPMGDSLDERLAGLGQLVDLVNEVNAEEIEAAEAEAMSSPTRSSMCAADDVPTLRFDVEE